ncbi:MAG: hypothetical protein CUN56_00095 [Phototrophicales bacterium]|nr:MAG: hypothetical protein CUN56_00095 [Phototrophicales bacterium]
MTYFSNCQTVAEIKKIYRQLAMDNHPDRGGSNAKMQAINEAYHKALKSFHKKEMQGHTYYYNKAHEQAIMDMIAKLKKATFPEGVNIALIGKWLWITGTQKGDGTRETLKELNTEEARWKWHSKRKAWYWKPTQWSGKAHKGSLEEIAAKYGENMIDTPRKKPAALNA